MIYFERCGISTHLFMNFLYVGKNLAQSSILAKFDIEEKSEIHTLTLDTIFGVKTFAKTSFLWFCVKNS